MSEFIKYLPNTEALGQIQFRKFEAGVKYELDPQLHRHRLVTRTGAPEYSLVSVTFLKQHDGSIDADVRDIVLSGDMKLRDQDEHNLAAILIDNGLMPITSFDILGSNKVYGKTETEDDAQPDPTQPLSHLKDYFPKGPTSRGDRSRR